MEEDLDARAPAPRVGRHLGPARRSLDGIPLDLLVGVEGVEQHGQTLAFEELADGSLAALVAGPRAATDLAAIWMLFAEPHARQAALAAYGDLSEATLRRAQGWAVVFGVVLLETGLVDNPRHAAIGQQTLRHLA